MIGQVSLYYAFYIFIYRFLMLTPRRRWETAGEKKGGLLHLDILRPKKPQQHNVAASIPREPVLAASRG